MIRSVFAIIGLFSLLFAAGCSAPTTTTNTANTANSAQNNANSRPSPAAPADTLATGRNLYELNCAKCHKETGVGGVVEVDGKKLNPDNLTSDKIKKFSDEKILGYISDGIEDEGMPAFKDKLSEAEMREIVRYVRVALQRMPEANANTAANANAAPANAANASANR